MEAQLLNHDHGPVSRVECVGDRVACFYEKGGVTLYCLSKGAESKAVTSKSPPQQVTTVQCVENLESREALFYCGTKKGKLFVLKTSPTNDTVEVTEASTCHGNVVSASVVSKRHSLLATGALDGDIILWDISSPVAKHSYALRKHQEGVVCLDFDEDNALLFSGSSDKTIGIWDIDGKRLVRLLTDHTDWVIDLCFLPPCHALASCSWDSTVALWDGYPSFLSVETKVSKDDEERADTMTITGKHSIGSIRSIDGSDPGTGTDEAELTVASATSATRTVRGQCAKRLKGHGGAVFQVEWVEYDNDIYLFSASEDETIMVYCGLSNLETMHPMGALRHQGVITKMCVDGAMLYAVVGHLIHVWHWPTGDLVYVAQGHLSPITSLSTCTMRQGKSFKGDTRRDADRVSYLITADEDGAIKTWDVTLFHHCYLVNKLKKSGAGASVPWSPSPSDMDIFKTVTTLVLRGCHLEVFPHVSLPHLRWLDLGHNRLVSLDSLKEAFPTLRVADLSHNMLTDLLDIEYKQLEVFHVNYNKITSLPASLSQAPMLKVLSLANNHILSLPPVINLPRLELLDLSENKLRYLPGDMHMPCLTVLGVKANRLRVLSPKVGYLSTLLDIDVEGNDMLFPSPQFLSKNPEPAALLELLRQMDSETISCSQAQLLVLGRENVGKTTLVTALSQGRKKSLFSRNPDMKPHISTDGIDILTDPIRLDIKKTTRKAWAANLAQADNDRDRAVSAPATVATGNQAHARHRTTSSGGSGEVGVPTSVTLQTFDFGGQEIFHNTHQYFLSDNAIYLVVWSMLHSPEYCRLKFWLSSLRIRCPQARVIIVGTFLDDKRVNVDSARASLRKLLADLGRADLLPHVVGQVEISSRNFAGYDRLRELIETACASLPHLSEPMPKRFEVLARILSAMAPDLSPPVLPTSVYIEIAAGIGLDDAEAMVALRRMHASGQVIFYSQSGLDDQVILDPQFLPRLFKSLVSFRHRFFTNGMILVDQLHSLLAEQGLGELSLYVINTFDRFNICFTHQPSAKARGGLLVHTQTDVDSEGEGGSKALKDSRQVRYLVFPFLLPIGIPSSYHWPPTVAPGVGELSRAISVRFLPCDLVPRLAGRFARRYTARVFTRNHFVFDMPKGKGSDKFRLDVGEGETTFHITVRAAGKVEDVASRIVAQVLNYIEHLYPHEAPYIHVDAVCTDCLGLSFSRPTLWPLEDVKRALAQVDSGATNVDSDGVLQCRHGHDVIPRILLHGTVRVPGDGEGSDAGSGRSRASTSDTTSTYGTDVSVVRSRPLFFVPIEHSSTGITSLLSTTFALEFLCGMPNEEHFIVPQEVYPIRDPVAFFHRFHGHLERVALVFKQRDDDQLYQQVMSCMDAFTKRIGVAWHGQHTDATANTDTQDRSAMHTVAALNEGVGGANSDIYDFLVVPPGDKVPSRLSMFLLVNGEIRWLCEEHAHRMQALSSDLAVAVDGLTLSQ